MSAWVRLASWLSFRFDEGQAVDADRHLDDRLHAGRDAGLILALLDLPRCVLDVREVRADTAAEQLHARARAGRFDDHADVGIIALELLGDRGREGIDGRRADHLELLLRRATLASAIASTRGERRRKRQREHDLLHMANSRFGPIPRNRP